MFAVGFKTLNHPNLEVNSVHVNLTDIHASQFDRYTEFSESKF